MHVPTVRLVGPGRAGLSLQGALASAGWQVLEPLRRGDDLSAAGDGADVVVVATPDAVVAEVAAAIRPNPAVAVVHLAGSLGLDVLAPHPRRASLHPLVPLPDPETGAGRLAGAWFAVAGDATARTMVSDLGGRVLVVDDGRRTAYHAAATIASNHLVALLGQVERVATTAGVPLAAYLDLVRATVDNVAALGPAGALTGPVSRGDWATVARHVAVLDPDERPGYEAMAALADRLADGGVRCR